MTKYKIKQSGIKKFNKAFPEHKLLGDELATAMTIFLLLKDKPEFRYKVVILSKEKQLLEFAKMNKWNFEIIDEKSKGYVNPGTSGGTTYNPDPPPIVKITS
ncbi:MAG: hypothetical protein WCY09_09180 [Candidatus Omnitrophota bacterium]|jgi:hypothetical protein